MLCLFCCLGRYWTLESFRVAIALRVGEGDVVCIPHSCHCGRRMDSRGLHGLSCKYTAGCFPRHSAMHDVNKRALQKASLPSVLEPPGLNTEIGYALMVFLFSGGRSLVWDCTSVYTFSGGHLNKSAMEAGTAANYAKEHKCSKKLKTLLS